jgi:hypothetical protein
MSFGDRIDRNFPPKIFWRQLFERFRQSPFDPAKTLDRAGCRHLIKPRQLVAQTEANRFKRNFLNNPRIRQIETWRHLAAIRFFWSPLFFHEIFHGGNHKPLKIKRDIVKRDETDFIAEY